MVFVRSSALCGVCVCVCVCVYTICMCSRGVEKRQENQSMKWCGVLLVWVHGVCVVWLYNGVWLCNAGVCRTREEYDVMLDAVVDVSDRGESGSCGIILLIWHIKQIYLILYLTFLALVYIC